LAAAAAAESNFRIDLLCKKKERKREKESGVDCSAFFHCSSGCVYPFLMSNSSDERHWHKASFVIFDPHSFIPKTTRGREKIMYIYSEGETFAAARSIVACYIRAKRRQMVNNERNLCVYFYLNNEEKKSYLSVLWCSFVEARSFDMHLFGLPLFPYGKSKNRTPSSNPTCS
jgi:hypothetical protein